MNPRLAAMAGPLEGTVIPLPKGEVLLGRDRANRIWINDVSVSRHHCVIKSAGDEYHITDLESHNGTRVNGTPVGERLLEHGDMIAVGESLFLFLCHDDEQSAAETTSVEIREERCEIQTTVVLRIEDALYLQPDKLLAALPTTARIARGLNALLNVSTAINSIAGVEALEKRLLELIFDMVPAERGALLLTSDASDEFASVFGRDRLGAGSHPSRSAARSLIRSGTTVSQSCATTCWRAKP